MLRRSRSLLLLPGAALAVTVGLTCTLTSAGAAPATGITATEQAAAISLAAKAQADKGDYAACAAMYLQAFAVDSKTLGYLYSAARCAHLGGKWDDARRDYRLYLERADANDRLRSKAAAHVQEVEAAAAAAAAAAQRQAAEEQQRRAAQDRQLADAEAKRRAAEAEATRLRAAAAERGRLAAVATARAPRPAAAPAWRTPTRWAGVGLGAVAAGVGVWVLADGIERRSALFAQLDTSAKASPDGKIRDVSADGARSQLQRADDRIALGSAVAGVGLLGGGLAFWLLREGDRSRVALTPAGLRGARLTVRF